MRFNVSFNSCTLASVCLGGTVLYRCLAPLSAATGCLEHCLLWSGLGSTDVIVEIWNLRISDMLDIIGVAPVSLRAVQEA